MDQVSDQYLPAWLIWFHAAFVLVPAVILTIKMEWQDWKSSHYRITPQSPRDELRAPPLVRPMPV